MEIIRRCLEFSQLQRSAIVCAGQSYSYRALLDASTKLSQAIIGRQQSSQGSSTRSSRIGLYAAPSIEYAVATLAIWQSGGIVVPLGTSFPTAELSYLFEDAGINLALSTPDAADKVGEVASAHGAALHVLESPPSDQPTNQSASLAEPHVSSHHQQRVKGGSQANQLPACAWDTIHSSLARQSAEDGALIIYTSGTTGKPKGVLHSHRSLAAQMDSLCTAWEWSHQDTILHPLPLHHIHGIVNALYCPLYAGARVDFLPKFSPTAVWERIMEGDMSVFMGVPTMYAKLLSTYDAMPAVKQAAAAAAAASLRLTVSGSSACPVPIMQRWKQLTGQYLLERYGMTETGMVLSNPYKGHREPGSVGVPLPHVGVCIAADGELCVRGPTLFSCYWRRPEDTAQAFDDEGYFRTGDTAACLPAPARSPTGQQGPADGNASPATPPSACSSAQNGARSPGSHGHNGWDRQTRSATLEQTLEQTPEPPEGRPSAHYYTILGRTSVDIIKASGFKVSALQVESTLLEHPWAAEVAVLGVPDLVHGEVITALVFPDPSKTAQIPHSALQQGLHQHCLAHLAPYQAPRSFVILNAPLPRNAMGKINKKELLQMFFGRELDQSHSMLQLA